MKCSQISKPTATVARNQNSISDRIGGKNLGKNQVQTGGQYFSDQKKTSMVCLIPDCNTCHYCAEDSPGSCGIVPMAVEVTRSLQGSVSMAHLVDMVTADIQGC